MSTPTIADLESTFFTWERPQKAMERISSFRSFSEYVGFPRKDWRSAFQHVFGMDAESGNRRLEGFRPWLLQRGYSPVTARAWLYNVRPFFGYAYRRGALGWKIGNKHEDRSATLWSRCTPAFQRALKEWLENMTNRNYSRHTIGGYRVHVLRLGHYLAQRKIRGVSVPLRIIRDWIKHLQSLRIKPISSHSYIRSASTFFNWLVSRNKASYNPLKEFPVPKSPRYRPRFVSEGQILKLLRAAKHPRERAMLECLYASGCRLGELVSIDLADVSFKARTATCMGKGNKERLLMLNRAAIRAIRAWLPLRREMLKRPGGTTEPALFVTWLGRRIATQGVCKLISDIVKKARFRVPLSAHVVRHSTATHLLNRGADLETIRELLGHTNAGSTLIYAHQSKPRFRSAFLKAQPKISSVRRT